MKILNSKKIKKISFSDLSSSDKKKIIMKAVRKSNEEQLDLVKRYENAYKDLK
jgi:hypothetical protein